MIGLIQEKREAIAQLCQRYRVKRLELFGSALTGQDYHVETSDLDFLVEFLPLGSGRHADAYFGLLEGIEDMFQCHVDLVMTSAINNPYFLQSINRNRELIYAA